MRKIIEIVLLCLLCLLSSCKQSREALQVSTRRLPALLESVASDAIIVEYYHSLKDYSPILEESAPLCELSYGKLAENEAVVSWFDVGKIIPVLSLSVENADSTLLASIQIQSRKQKLFCKLVNSDKKRRYLLISASESRLNAALRHVNEAVSILDNKQFCEAALNSHGNFVVARRNGAKKIAKTLLQDAVPAKKLDSFIDNFAEWFTFYQNGEKYLIKTVQPKGNNYYFRNIMENLSYCESHLPEIISEETIFAVSLPLVLPQYRYDYENFLEAHSKKSAYQSEMRRYRNTVGIDPSSWELAQKLQEIILVRYEGRGELILLRTAKRETKEIGENGVKGIIPLLYGGLFSLSDDSYCAKEGKWYAIGPKELVGYFVEKIKSADEQNEPKMRNVRAVVKTSNNTICWTNKGIELWTQ